MVFFCVFLGSEFDSVFSVAVYGEKEKGVDIVGAEEINAVYRNERHRGGEVILILLSLLLDHTIYTAIRVCRFLSLSIATP